jgi:hypothetical protein
LVPCPPQITVSARSSVAPTFPLTLAIAPSSSSPAIPTPNPKF